MTVVRVYLPVTVDDLRTLERSGALTAPRDGYAVTSDLRRERPAADLDELEYLAFGDAAAAAPAAARVVAAADVDSDEVSELVAAQLPVSAVRVEAAVPRRAVASFHVAGGAGAGSAADGIPEHSWYDATELAVVLDLVT